MATNRGYPVGYGKPPKASQWKKGQSGNPRGRSKGARGLKTDLHDELSTTLAIKVNGKELKGTTQQLMLRTLAMRAASGDVRASRVLIDLILQVFGIGDRGGDRDGLSPQDQALLDQWLVVRDPAALAVAPEPSAGGSGSGCGNPSSQVVGDQDEPDE